jgi:2-oxoacid:acceptor oxidoreductase delta subunit (pyruvate/2-ketoisovalerate family)
MKLESEIKQTEKQVEKDIRWKAFIPVLDPKKCDPTCPCIVYCPRQAIVIANNKPKIDYSLCDGCLICLRECPHGAITEEKGSSK